MRILFLSRWFPFPPDNGSRLRVYNLLRGLSPRHEVTLLSFAEHGAGPGNSPELGSLCPEIRTVTRKHFRPNSLGALAGFFNFVPRSVTSTYSEEMEAQIREALSGNRFDLIIASQEGTAGYARCFGGVPAIFEEVEVSVLHEQYAAATALWRRFRHGLTWAKEKRYLARLLKRFSACTVVSEPERRLLQEAVRVAPAVEVVPNCVNLTDYVAVRRIPQVNHLIFAGALSYHPNHDAMAWFLREIYSRIQGQEPGVHLTITGDHANLPLPPASNVTLTGWVEDVRARIASSWVSIAPIREGGGTRLKILESMALRTPVVTTSKGAEGLDVEPGRHLLVADTPSAFADAVLRVMKEPELRSRLAENAFQVVSDKYNWSAVMPRFLQLVERVARSDGSQEWSRPCSP